MIQEALFEMPVVETASKQPPQPPAPVILAEPLGTCCKCGQEATLSLPNGTVYCKQCGRCKRKVYGVMKGVVVLRRECKVTVENFVMHPRISAYVCPCVLKYDEAHERKRARRSDEEQG